MQSSSATAALTVGIFVFDDIEVLDLGGPFEVFSTATRMQARDNGNAGGGSSGGTGDGPFRVVTVAERRRPIRARGGLEVVPQHDFTDHPKIDLLVVPGGVVDGELAKDSVAGWIAGVAAGAQLIAAVCTGSFLLARAGLLEGVRATTHWEDLDDLARRFPSVEVVRDVRWVDAGRVVTSAGISAGIDMCLHLVARLAGRQLAERTARQMDYAWQSHPASIKATAM